MGRSRLRSGDIFGLVPNVDYGILGFGFLIPLGIVLSRLDLSLLSGTPLRTCALLARGYLAGLSTSFGHFVTYAFWFFADLGRLSGHVGMPAHTPWAPLYRSFNSTHSLTFTLSFTLG